MACIVYHLVIVNLYLYGMRVPRKKMLMCTTDHSVGVKSHFVSCTRVQYHWSCLHSVAIPFISPFVVFRGLVLFTGTVISVVTQQELALIRKLEVWLRISVDEIV